eukprot:jgi/Chrpa1/2517/Chrysochromulina_OHIO_Genome00014947-RA
MPKETIVRIENKHSVAMPPATPYAFVIILEPCSTRYIIATAEQIKMGTERSVTPATSGLPSWGTKARMKPPPPYPIPTKSIACALNAFWIFTIASANCVESSSGLETSYHATSCRSTALRYARLYLSICRAVIVSMMMTAMAWQMNIPTPM